MIKKIDCKEMFVSIIFISVDPRSIFRGSREISEADRRVVRVMLLITI